MEYTLTEAAHATGLSRPTVFRAIKKGVLSARREEDRSYRIDASELARVFPVVSLKQADPVHRNEQKRPETSETPTVPEVELALLHVELRMTREQLARERELRDQERESVERERETIRDTVADLRRRLDRAEERVLALSALPIQPAPIAPESAVEEPRKAAMGEAAPRASRSLLARLLGF